jgi:uncharacterized protein
MDNDELVDRKEELDLAIASARTQRPVGSPCIDVCKMNPSSGYCEGCLRTRGEIKAWKSMGDEERLVLLDRLGVRSSNGV